MTAWEHLVDELDRAKLPPDEAQQRRAEISATLALARLQLELASGRRATPITLRRTVALADCVERRALSAWTRLELARGG